MTNDATPERYFTGMFHITLLQRIAEIVVDENTALAGANGGMEEELRHYWSGILDDGQWDYYNGYDDLTSINEYNEEHN